MGLLKFDAHVRGYMPTMERSRGRILLEKKNNAMLMILFVKNNPIHVKNQPKKQKGSPPS
jgi:hypothetical protein